MFLNKLTKVDDAFPHECAFSYKLTRVKVLTSIKDVLKHGNGTCNVKGRLVFNREVESPEKFKQSAKDALLADSTETIPLSVWKEHFGSLLTDSFYEPSNLKLRCFNGKTLTTLPYNFTTLNGHFYQRKLWLKSMFFCSWKMMKRTSKHYQYLNPF